MKKAVKYFASFSHVNALSEHFCWILRWNIRTSICQKAEKLKVRYAFDKMTVTLNTLSQVFISVVRTRCVLRNSFLIKRMQNKFHRRSKFCGSIYPKTNWMNENQHSAILGAGKRRDCYDICLSDVIVPIKCVVLSSMENEVVSVPLPVSLQPWYYQTITSLEGFTVDLFSNKRCGGEVGQCYNLHAGTDLVTDSNPNFRGFVSLSQLCQYRTREFAAIHAVSQKLPQGLISNYWNLFSVITSTLFICRRFSQVEFLSMNKDTEKPCNCAHKLTRWRSGNDGGLCCTIFLNYPNSACNFQSKEKCFAAQLKKVTTDMGAAVAGNTAYCNSGGDKLLWQQRLINLMSSALFRIENLIFVFIFREKSESSTELHTKQVHVIIRQIPGLFRYYMLPDPS